MLYVLTINLIVLFSRATFATPNDPAAARRRHRKSNGASSSSGGPSSLGGAGISAQKRQRLMTESSEDSDPYDDMDWVKCEGENKDFYIAFWLKKESHSSNSQWVPVTAVVSLLDLLEDWIPNVVWMCDCATTSSASFIFESLTLSVRLRR